MSTPTITVTADITDGASIVDAWDSGYTVQRVFQCLITNDGGIHKSGYGQACCEDAAIPVKGDVHPYNSSLICTTKNGTPHPGGKQWRIICTYAYPVRQVVPSSTNPAIWTFDCSTQSVQTNKDSSGSDLSVGFTGSFNGKTYTTAGSGADITNDTQTATVAIEYPQSTITAERLEGTNPSALQPTYVYHTNSASVTWKGTTYAAKSLLCKGISGTTNDGGNSYTVKYIFAFKSDLWNPTTVFFEADGVPVPGTSTTFNLYPTVAFSGLNLS